MKNKAFFATRTSRVAAATALAATLFAATAIGLVSCDAIKAGLSTSLDPARAADIGTASIAADTVYYNGAKANDMSATTENSLAISFSQPANLSEGGLSGSFELSYTAADGSATTKAIALSGCEFSADGMTCGLYLAPVMEFFDGAQIPSGEATLKVKASGFVNDGTDTSTRGEMISGVTKTVSLKPLYKVDPAAHTFSTVYDTTGSSLSIATNGAVTLSGGSSLSVAAHAGSTLPAGLSAASFSLSANDAGFQLTSLSNLYGETFVMDLTIRGIAAPGQASMVSKTFTVSFSPVLIVMDGVEDANYASADAVSAADPATDAYAGSWSQPNCEVTKIAAINSPTTLYVGATFSSVTGFWNDDRFVIMISRGNSGSGGAVSQADFDLSTWVYPAAAFTASDGCIDTFLYHNPGAGSGAGAGLLEQPKAGAADVTDSDDNWTATPANWSAYPMGWSNPNGPSFVEYSINLAAAGLASGDTIRIYFVLSNSWSGTFHSTDIVPGSTHPDDTASVNYDFANALTMTLR